DLERLASVDLLARIEDAFDGRIGRRRVPMHLPQVEDEEEAEPHRMAVHLEGGIPHPLHESEGRPTGWPGVVHEAVRVESRGRAVVAMRLGVAVRLPFVPVPILR